MGLFVRSAGNGGVIKIFFWRIRENQNGEPLGMKKGAALMDVAIRKFHFLKCLNYQDFSVQLQFWKEISQASAIGV